MFTKPINEITFEDVKSFCQEWGEGVRVEYKSQMVGKKQIPKIISSFANTVGGILFIGVEANKTKNEVIFPIQGIPKTPGIQEQIQQSALEGIYPAVTPDVLLIDVPDSDNIVVVIRVDESAQAPHWIQNSTRVYVRPGSITKPYDLADMDRLTYLLKRREDSQIVAQQILNRIVARAKRNFLYDVPTLTIITQPVFPYRPVISTSNIYELCRTKLSPIRRVEGGVCNVYPENYLEFNEYGVVYHRISLHFSDQQEIDYTIFIRRINYLIEQVIDFYKECNYLGNIEISALLQEVLGKKLMDPDSLEYGWSITDNIPEGPVCFFDSEVPASKQCLFRDLENEEKRKDIVEELVCQLLWSFNIAADHPKVRERVRDRIR